MDANGDHTISPAGRVAFRLFGPFNVLNTAYDGHDAGSQVFFFRLVSQYKFSGIGSTAAVADSLTISAFGSDRTAGDRDLAA